MGASPLDIDTNSQNIMVTRERKLIVMDAWNNGNRHPGWGVAEIQKMSPPTTVGDAADMQLCVIKQGSPPVLENVAFFVTDLLTLARCAVCILNISVGME